MQLRRVAALALVAGCGSAAAAKVPTAAPVWEVPADWRTETIPFPLEFAPALPYRGVEELRFPKPFLDPESEWYFSYAFVWHVAAPGPADAAALEGDLTAYFRGLAIAVGGVERADIAAHPFAAELEGDLAAGTVNGRVVAFDAFKTQRPVTLQFHVRRVSCSSEQERALVFTASPRTPADGDPVWVELERLASSFRCP